MESLILWMLCSIFIAVTMQEKNMGAAFAGGTLLYIFFMFLHWQNPDAPAYFAAFFDRAAQFISDAWDSIVQFLTGEETK